MRKVLSLPFKPSHKGFFLGLEIPKVDPLSIEYEAGAEEARFMALYPPQSNLGISANLLILMVLGYGRLTQIAPSAVRWISVNVVNPNRRPFPRYQKPCDPMRTIKIVTNSNVYIAIRSAVASLFSFSDTRYPKEDSLDGIVGNNGACLLGGKIVLSHDAPVQRIGQRSRRGDNASWPRHYCMGLD